MPLYTYPTDPSWNTVIAGKAAHPTVGVIAVVNPANGPGAAADPAYASGIARLNAAGIKVIGYVATGYAVNSAVAVKADIDRWRAFYPGQISGIFFDEQSNRAGDVAVLSRPVAIREGAGAVVHGRQSRDGQRAGVRRRAGHDADLRERGAAVGAVNSADGMRVMRRRTSA